MANWWDEAPVVESGGDEWWKAAPVVDQPPSVARDMAQSAATGLGEGTLDIVGQPRDLASTVARGGISLAGSAANKIRGLFGLSPNPEPTPEQLAQVDRSVALMTPLGGSAENKKRIESVTGQWPEAQTRAGKFAQTAARFVPGALLAPTEGPASLVSVAGNAVKYGVIPGLASEAAGQATEGSKYEPLARIAAALGAGGVSALASRPAYMERAVGSASREVSPQQFEAARNLMREAEGMGIKLTADEAIQHATGGATRLSDIRRVVESTQEGGVPLAAAMAERPGQVEAASRNIMGQIAPMNPEPSMAGVQLQKAGKGALDDTRRSINKIAEPYYNAARDVGGDIDVSNVLSHIDDTIAPLKGQPGSTIQNELQKFRDLISGKPSEAGSPAARTPVIDPKSGRTIRYENIPADPGVPAGTASQLQRLELVKTELGDAITSAQTKGDNNRARLLTQIQKRLLESIDTARPDYATARGIVDKGRQAVLDPLQAGPVGKIADTAGVTEQSSALMPRNPLPGSEAEASRAARALMGQNPDATRSVVRLGLESDLNRTGARLTTNAQPDQFGGARFAADLLGNPQRAANVRSVVGEVAGQPTRENLDKLLTVLQATGTRQRPGSMTAFNKEMLDEMRKGGVTAVAEALAQPTSPLKRVGDAVSKFQLGRQGGQLAELLLSGEQGVSRIQELAARGDTRARLILQMLSAEETSRKQPAP